MADFFPSILHPFDLGDYDSDSDRDDFIGIPGHQSQMFSPEIWYNHIFTKKNQPPEHLQSDPD